MRPSRMGPLRAVGPQDGQQGAHSDEGNASVEAAVKAKVVAVPERFPLYTYIG